MVVPFVGIGGIVDHRRLTFFFIKYWSNCQIIGHYYIIYNCFLFVIVVIFVYMCKYS